MKSSGFNTIIKRIAKMNKDIISDQNTSADESSIENIGMVNVAENFDCKHIWAFNSGHHGDAFRGNPKFLFIYINYYRPDIYAYWISKNREIVDFIRGLGFNAYYYDSPEAGYIMSKTGVAVNEQVRGLLPFRNDTKYLNLWHGHGFKTCERARIEDDDDLRLDLARKYIKNNEIYRNNMIVTCVNPLQEKYFLTYIGVPERNMLHAGYPRCTYQKKYKRIETFNHDIKGMKGLPEDTLLAAYTPTYRAQNTDSFTDAIPNIEELYRCCEENNILLIFKMHPLMENDAGFISAKEIYGDMPHFLFWDNHDDFYEIMDKIDIAIYDYSSIFNDFLLSGVTHYIRYIYDSENMISAACVNSEEEYYKYTYGNICKSFIDMCNALANITSEFDEDALNKIKTMQWEYSDDDDMDKIISFTMDFEVDNVRYPNLYTFDIFDTLIAREGMMARSIFYAVKDKMEESDLFKYFHDVYRYPEIRLNAERCLREYMRKSQIERNSFHNEISLRQIIERIAESYDLSEEQTNALVNWEEEAEIAAVIPKRKYIEEVKRLIKNGEKVYLISDMYLSHDVIKKMLYKADPILSELPFFLSSDYGVQKSSKLLFFEVYRSFKPYYNFGRWIHTGDNANSDRNQARYFNIETRKIDIPVLNKIELNMAEALDNYNGFCLAAYQMRLREEYINRREEFTIDFIAPLFTSYINWVINDAVKKGIKKLYFVARDGHFLKMAADSIIQNRGLPLTTKYIYASRRVWRIASFVDQVDDEFFSDIGGNFCDINSKEKFIRAAGFESEEEFNKILPQIDISNIDFSDWSKGQPGKRLGHTLSRIDGYLDYLLSKAKDDREIAGKYLIQEVDADESHAFVEFWGRGYNQKCHSRIWNDVLGRKQPVSYYYAKSLFPSDDLCIRNRFTAMSTELYFLEGIFANMPYKSLEKYEETENGIVPVLEKIEYDVELYRAMEDIIPVYASKYAEYSLRDSDRFDHDVFDFLLKYYENNKDDPFIYENFGSLIDSVSMYGDKREFARPYTKKDLELFYAKSPRARNSMSISMSYYRSSEDVRSEYDLMYQLKPGDNVAGSTVLTKNEVNENKKYRKKIDDSLSKANKLKKLYSKACKENQIENTAIILTSFGDEGDNLYTLYKRLISLTSFEVKIIKTKEITNLESFAEELSKASVVIANDNIPFMSSFSYREDTLSIFARTSALPLGKRGHSIKKKLKNEKLYNNILFDMQYDMFEKASDYAMERTIDDYAVERKHIQWLDGSLITDVYFDDVYKYESLEKLYDVFPEAYGKKVILYMPSLRKKDGQSEWLELLDIKEIAKRLSHEFVMAIDCRDRKQMITNCPNILEVDGFSKILNSSISLRRMICAADIIIGDYRDTLLECSLIKKPIFFSGFDWEQKIKDENVLSDIIRDIPFPMVHNAEEFCKYVENVDNYNYSCFEPFKEKYFKYCDGHTADRLLEILKQRDDM